MPPSSEEIKKLLEPELLVLGDAWVLIASFGVWRDAKISFSCKPRNEAETNAPGIK
jgi:hypothetical protein